MYITLPTKKRDSFCTATAAFAKMTRDESECAAVSQEGKEGKLTQCKRNAGFKRAKWYRRKKEHRFQPSPAQPPATQRSLPNAKTKTSLSIIDHYHDREDISSR